MQNEKISKEFVILMAFMTSIMAFSIDAILPALDSIGSELHFKNITDTQYIISIIFLGFGVGLFIFGPISDAFGRKPPIFIGGAIFLIGCITSLDADSFTPMIIGRFLQGLGASAFRIISIAIIRDKFDGARMAKTMSLVMTIFILVPVLAPSIGQLVLIKYHWKAIIVLFSLMCITSLLWFGLRQEETHPENKRNSLSFKFIFKATLETLTTPLSLISIIVSGFIFGGFIAYLSSSQIIFQKIYLVGDNFPLYFGSLALTVGISSFVNSFLVQKYGLLNLVNFALKLMTLSLVPLLIFQLTTENTNPSLLFFMVSFAIMFFLVGLLFGNLNALALAPLGHIAGVASSVVGAVQNMISVTISVIIVKNITDSVFPLLNGFMLLSLISYLIIAISLKTGYLNRDI